MNTKATELLPQLGVVIVTHNSAAHLAACLNSALSYTNHVVVVDNASSDDTVAIAHRDFPGVRLAANPDNRGFAGGVNQGVRALPDEAAFILLLNPDACLLTSPAPMLAQARQPRTGAVGGRLVTNVGADQAGFTIRRFPTVTSLIFETLGLNRLFPWNPVNRRYRALDLDLTRPQPVDQPPGALLLFPRAIWAELGGFDERFHPVWFEDVDFLRRVAKAGYEIWYTPETRAEHAGGHSVLKLQLSERQQFWYGNLLQYAALHAGPPMAVRLVAAAVLVGIGIRRLFTRTRGAAAVPGRGSVAGLAWRLCVHGTLPSASQGQLRKA
ncbi:MAG: glycosyltransferase family 2 protein [Bryobacterales bacterium]|nr:glycosyltransferase family 2 protein [Bryobacterales bacterium]